MKQKSIFFFPRTGERNSPKDFMDLKCSNEEIANINGKLRKLLSMPAAERPRKWAKKVNDFRQLTQGDFRVLWKELEIGIIVFHVCRKVTQKTKAQDLLIAEVNFNNYLILDKTRKNK
jgi:phage-related protein